MKQTQNFTEGRIFAPLVRFALPVLLALFLQTMYGAVDLGIVGRFGGGLSDVYVSAVSTGSQIMHTVTIVITGLAMGLTVFVGKKIGAGQRQEAGQIIGSGICLFGVLAVMVSAAMVWLADSMAQVMNAPEEAFEQTVIYITICSAGAVFIVAYNLVGSIFRCYAAGHRRRVWRAAPGVVSHEQTGSGLAVPYRSCHPRVHRDPDHSMRRLLCNFASKTGKTSL